MEASDARSLSCSAQADLRRKAVKACLAGNSQQEVAEMFGVTRRAVNGWVSTYRVGGWNALNAKKQGRPRGGGRLKPWQCAQISKAVIDRTPEQLKLPFYLWTREAVAKLIEKRFGTRYSLMQVGRMLKRWGFTPQKPVRRAYEQDPKAVQQWLAREYPAIKRRAKAEKAQIYWGDEMGLCSDHAAGRSWGKRGETPVIPGTGKRFRCNVVSAITNRGKLRFMVFKKRFQSRIFTAFMDRLCKDAKRRVYLIVDRHPVHRSAAVRKWLEKNAHRIRMFYLPSYSPQLNPDEILNQDVKTNAVGRKKPHTQPEMMGNIRGYLHSRQRRPGVVMKYFDEEHVRYAK